MALFLKALPQSTGTPSPASVARRMARRSSSTVGSCSWTNLSMSSSSWSASFSNSSWWASVAASRYSSGISVVSHSSPISLIHRWAFISTRSMTPTNPASLPHGSWTTKGFALRRSSIIRTVRPKSAPVRSILLMKQIRGTPYRSAWRHTVSVCGSTPATASNTPIAPSSTRSDRSTSTVKSTWPGVSMRLIQWPFQLVVVAADVMVMPRSRSWTIQSIWAVPSWTSPTL